VLLNETEVDVTNLVVERFLNLGEATPRRGLLLKARSRDMLDKLSRWSILRLYDNRDFLPLPLAFHFCGNTEASLLAKRSITLLGHVLRNLFENDLNEGTQYTSAEVEDHTRKMYGRVNSREIRLGLYLGPEFNFFMSWSSNQTHTQVTSFGISEHIILGGQCKTSHASSLQNRPCEMARDVILFIPLSADQASLFWFSNSAAHI
jgi:hypothetical protein